MRAKSRQVSCGFLACEIDQVTERIVWLKDGRRRYIDTLNGREDDELAEWRKGK